MKTLPTNPKVELRINRRLSILLTVAEEAMSGRVEDPTYLAKDVSRWADDIAYMVDDLAHEGYRSATQANRWYGRCYVCDLKIATTSHRTCVLPSMDPHDLDPALAAARLNQGLSLND